MGITTTERISNYLLQSGRMKPIGAYRAGDVLTGKQMRRVKHKANQLMKQRQQYVQDSIDLEEVVFPS
jgi:hypothetical protein